MLYNAKNGTLNIGGTTMDYIRCGTGERILVMLPGLGDGLRSMKGTALPEGYTTRDMARDQAEAMEQLGIGCPDIFGVSMGGMIAQHLAIDYPEKWKTVIRHPIRKV